MSPPEPYISEAEDQSAGRSATFIFLHGFSDDAEGIPLGLAQQFQFNHKLPYLTWLLPNAGRHPEAMENAWYMPKALPNALKPRVPGTEQEDESAPDDEEGILAACDRIDELVRKELDRGVEKDRIVVGGFSQGCAVSLVWGLVGKERNNVAGMVPICGYFPLADRIGAIRKVRGYSGEPEAETKKWMLGHGDRDVLVPTSLFKLEAEALGKWVDMQRDVEGHLYERMGHSTSPALLRDLLAWLSRVVPP
ncbi:hypothetical protein PMZ80_004016 [Knufia obscura]|uniref:Acyl-protein thioesterase 1 n=2 Tax=Knufia TaxID=430999 RepID=A0AAN8EJG5_9EURO|nr:hypothetical protein PMZ80_004016 [Knufia obscura]KAK5952257.1 hypothetical protein OHC33_006730 [Knufia fluminis]